MSSAFESSSIPLGSIKGIPIRLHVTFPVLLLLTLLSQGFHSWAAVGYAALLYGPVLLITVLIHELGHSFATLKAGGDAHGILLWPLGGLAYIGHTAGPRADLLIALAGPLTHVPMVALWLAALAPLYHAAYASWRISIAVPDPAAHFGLALAAGAVQLNIALAAFNLLLPAYPLDGGRIFASGMLLAGVGMELAARITAGVAVVLGLAVVGLGVWASNVLTLMVGAWMLWQTWLLVTCIREGRTESHPLFAAADGGGAGLPSVGKGSGYQQWNQDF